MKTINFGLGEPDFKTPENIVEAGNKAAINGKTKYSSVGGIKELIEAAKAAFQREGLDYSAEEIIIGAGSTHLISDSIKALIQHTGKKEIIAITPCWRKYKGLIHAAGGRSVLVEMEEADSFGIFAEKISPWITKNTAAIIINNPCNPTGYMIPTEELIKISDIADQNDIYIIYDQVYSSADYESKFTSMAKIDGIIKDRTITIESCSKRYSMTGYRIGYCGAPKTIIDIIRNLQDDSVWCLNTPSQYAAIEALLSAESQAAAVGMSMEFKRRRDYMHKRMNELGLVHTYPGGGFSSFVRIPEGFQNSKVFVDYLAKEANVIINPGTSFEKEGYVRFTFCCAIEDIEEGMNRIGSALKRRGGAE